MNQTSITVEHIKTREIKMKLRLFSFVVYLLYNALYNKIHSKLIQVESEICRADIYIIQQYNIDNGRR